MRAAALARNRGGCLLHAIAHLTANILPPPIPPHFAAARSVARHSFTAASIIGPCAIPASGGTNACDTSQTHHTHVRISSLSEWARRPHWKVRQTSARLSGDGLIEEDVSAGKLGHELWRRICGFRQGKVSDRATSSAAALDIAVAAATPDTRSRCRNILHAAVQRSGAVGRKGCEKETIGDILLFSVLGCAPGSFSSLYGSQRSLNHRRRNSLSMFSGSLPEARRVEPSDRDPPAFLTRTQQVSRAAQETCLIPATQRAPSACRSA